MRRECVRRVGVVVELGLEGDWIRIEMGRGVWWSSGESRSEGV